MELPLLICKNCANLGYRTITPGKRMKLSHRFEQDTCIVVMIGNLALSEINKVENYVQPLIMQGETTRILLNCQDVRVIDSRGIGLLVTIFKDLEKHEKSLALCNLNQNCLNVLKALKLDTMINIYDSLEAALSQ